MVRGEDGARDWLTKFLANDPKKFDGNGAILEAVNDGSLGAGLLNHYYWVQAVAEEGIGKVPSRLHFFGDGDPGALVNVAGVAVLKSSDDKEEAFDFVRQLLTRKRRSSSPPRSANMLWPIIFHCPSRTCRR